MEGKLHPDYEEERKYLEEVLKWVKEEKSNLTSKEEILEKEIREIRKSVTHLMDERLLAKQLLHKYAERNIKNLTYAQESPYFGRIDFQERGRDEREKIYIGKHGLQDREQEMPLVVDWRAPVADIYYSGHSKEVSYKTAYGEIKGSMHLKRRYEIKEGRLKEIYDEKTSEGRIEESLQGRGEFLLEALSKSNQGRLKEIVATIQDQQNRVIRSDMIKPLIVQGVAGSGKTTIALHRMAYLIYNNRRNIKEANYMVMAPNRLFLNYISEILPDLGVEDVVQTTFEDWAMKLLGKKMIISSRVDQLNQLMDENNQERKEIALASKIKGSILFKKVIDNRLKKLEASLIPEEDLRAEGIQLMDRTKIQEVFLTSNPHLSFDERIRKLSKYLKNRLKNDFSSTKEKIEEEYDKKLKELKEISDSQERIRPLIIELYEDRDEKIDRIKKGLNIYVDQYLNSKERLNEFNFYLGTFNDQEMERAFGSRIDKEVFSSMIERITSQLEQGLYENEDLAPLVYIRIKLFGLQERLKYTHIVVDEAQDFDEFKIAILREISLNDSFTFVGDLSQGIYSYKSINSWEKTMERVFKEKGYDYHILTTSYRSTVEIVNVANEVIKKCKDLKPVLAQPVFRHGKKPELIQCEKEVEMTRAIIDKVRELKEEQHQSIAIICKDLKTTKTLYNKLKNEMRDLYLLTDQMEDFKDGIVIIPSYLSKGLEFDSVILWNVNDHSYKEEAIDVKLLYIGITRALHHLAIYYTGEQSRVFYGLKEFFHSKKR